LPGDTILIVEDETTMASVLADNLRLEGYKVLIASDGALGLESWKSLKPSLVVLDVMLPRLSGYALCETMRGQGDRTPVLFLSAKGQPQDRVRGLEAGGDDYLAKPFHLPEFLLRVRALLRRQAWAAQGGSEHGLRFGGHHVDFASWTVTLAGGRKEGLGEREQNLLRLLAERAGEVVSRDDILDAVWGDEAFPSSRVLDGLVARLRGLFEPDPKRPVYLHTLQGLGYRFTPEGEAEEVNE
jgi:two-component system alkaline phosphatase synthesis response regulator PhoP